VRKNKGLNFTQRVAEQGEVALKALAKPGDSRVDGGQMPAILDQIPVDEGAPEPVDARNDVTLDDDSGILAGSQLGQIAATDGA
jgi:hypothetical protein